MECGPMRSPLDDPRSSKRARSDCSSKAESDVLIVAEDHILSSSSSLDSSPRTSLSAFTSRITPAFASPEHEISCKGAELPMGGWFHRCRGCGWKTAHQCRVEAQEVPCCKRCEDTIMKQPEQQQARLQQGLLYVHTAWCSAGL